MNAGGRNGLGSEALLAQAQEADREQRALVDTADVDTQYRAALASHIEAKHDQVERIEGRLENVISQE